MNPLLNVYPFIIITAWWMRPHLPLKRLGAIGLHAATTDVAQRIGQLRGLGREGERRPGISLLEAKTTVEPRDVPPRWEGLDAGEELRPYQKPEWRGKTSSDEMFREEIGRCAHHEGIPLSHYRMRER